MEQGILVINAGSSSIKFAVFTDLGRTEPKLVFKGQIESLGSDPGFQVRDASGTEIFEHDEWPRGSPLNHVGALRYILGWIEESASDVEIFAAGHRVVHGGLVYDRAVRIDDHVIADLEQLVPLALLHQPHNLAAIRALVEVAPELPQVACFDTAFHRTQPGSRNCLPCQGRSPNRACAVTAFTVCLTSTSPAACPTTRRTPTKWSSRISIADSRVSVWVIPTNEELMIALHVCKELAA